MKKRNRKKLIQFWIDPTEEAQIRSAMERIGMNNLSAFMRIILKSDVMMQVTIPTIMRVSEAHLETDREMGKVGKRAAG